MRAIVIGGVAAGMSAASKLRRLDPGAEIAVYERGSFLSYGACGLPYYVGGFNDDPGKLIARTQAQYDEMGVQTFLRHEVLRVDARAGRVLVRDHDTGREFEDRYDALMIAVGCKSIAPPIPGADLPSVFCLKTMEDGLLLREIVRLPDVRHVAVIGGGPAGLAAAIEAASMPANNRTFLIEISVKIIKIKKVKSIHFGSNFRFPAGGFPVSTYVRASRPRLSGRPACRASRALRRRQNRPAAP